MSDYEMISGTVAKAADRYAIETLGILSLELMERASRKVSDYIIRNYDPYTQILVVCGVGNNGADGICIARQLVEADFHPKVFVCGSMQKATEEFVEQMKGYTRVSGSVGYYLKGTPLPNAELLVDAVFGIGLKRPVEGEYRDFIQDINRIVKAKTIAVDLPSGINADTGALMGCGIPADLTITFGKNKLGLVQNSGKEYAGEVLVEDIGIPEEAYRAAVLKTAQIEEYHSY